MYIHTHMLYTLTYVVSILYVYIMYIFLVAQMVKNLPAMYEIHPGSVPGLGRSPGEGNGYPLQYSCLENSRVRRVWQAVVHGVTKGRT